MVEDLIYDVGMHRGKDTEYYLGKGFRVVAIDANPDFVEMARHRFSGEFNSGRLTILGVAISDQAGLADFWIDTNDDQKSSLIEENLRSWTSRRRIRVTCETFDTILREHGIPYYLKIDIEGADIRCIRALQGFKERPKYVSFECPLDSFDNAFEGLAELWTLGYRRFKLVNQARHIELRCPNPPLEGEYFDMKFDDSTSGPFGEETPGQWLTIGETIEKRLQIGRQQTTGRVYEASGRLFGLPLQRFHGLLKGVYNAALVRTLRKAYCTVLQREFGGWFDIHARYGD